MTEWDTQSSGTSRKPCRMLATQAVTALLMLAFSGAIACAQVRMEPRDETIDAGRRAAIIDGVTQTINQNYVFPEVAKRMEESVREKLNAGGYDQVTSAQEFAEVLTRDLREVCKDRHLGVRYAPEPPPAPSDDPAQRAAMRERRRREAAYNNFGFKKLELMQGNVGYLDLRGFLPAEIAGQTAVASMNFLSNCEAIIFDLRQNGGGDPSMIQLISSYFFDEPVHLNSFYIRKEDQMKQFWTSAHVEGKRLTDVDVYVLTSSFTFSAAEEFTYNLKNLKRATIVGETTGGGAHPVDGHYLADVHLMVMVPFGRAVNPITGTNWEGVGVSPDISVPADKALETAHLEALKKILVRTTEPEWKRRIAWAIEDKETELNPPTLESAVLRNYAGSYGPRTITFENGSLYYQREGRPKFKMMPMSNDTFRLEGLEGFRLKIEQDSTGTVIGLIGMYENGQIDRSPKSTP